MWKDLIVEEVRRARQKLFFETCGGDWDKYFAYIKATEAKGRAEGRTYISKHGPLSSKVARSIKSKSASK